MILLLYTHLELFHLFQIYPVKFASRLKVLFFMQQRCLEFLYYISSCFLKRNYDQTKKNPVNLKHFWMFSVSRNLYRVAGCNLCLQLFYCLFLMSHKNSQTQKYGSLISVNLREMYFWGSTCNVLFCFFHFSLWSGGVEALIWYIALSKSPN